METYTAVVEVDGVEVDGVAIDTDELLTRLAAHDPSFEMSPEGHLSAKISVVAESLFHATAMAISLVRTASRGVPVACQVVKAASLQAGPGDEAGPV
jgi:hypothetical protein